MYIKYCEMQLDYWCLKLANARSKTSSLSTLQMPKTGVKNNHLMDEVCHKHEREGGDLEQPLRDIT